MGRFTSTLEAMDELKLPRDGSNNYAANTYWKMCERAEAAEARAAALEKERDAFAEENEAIHRAVNELCGTDASTIEAVALVVKERDELKEWIKALEADRDAYHEERDELRATLRQMGYVTSDIKDE